jgi:hypothetical protein
MIKLKKNTNMIKTGKRMHVTNQENHEYNEK